MNLSVWLMMFNDPVVPFSHMLATAFYKTNKEQLYLCSPQTLSSNTLETTQKCVANSSIVGMSFAWAGATTKM